MGKRRSGEACKNQIESFREYLEDKELSDNTVRAYITAMEQYFSSFGKISKKNGLDWKRELQEKGLKAKSINIKLNAFNSFCGMVHDDGSKVKTMRVHQATAVSNVISEQDYKKLLDGLKNDGNMRWYYNIKLLASTGCRVSEYVRLKKTDFSEGTRKCGRKVKLEGFTFRNHFWMKLMGIIRVLGRTIFLLLDETEGKSRPEAFLKCL